jgi:hypothetical protein
MAAAGGVIVTSGAKQQALAAQQPPANTARVEKRTLSATVSQPGVLTYRAQSDGSPYPVINHARGTYTTLPAAGQVISQGRALYRVNNSPVVLLHGPTPAYRTLSAGVSGPDVAELNADLVALGYATSAQLHPTSAWFGTATTAALKKLQDAVGMTQTGRLTLGQAVFEPITVRVTSVSAQLGGSAQPGRTVIQATSTTREVQVALDASQQTSLAVGDKVTITLPDNHTSAGVVSSIGAVAVCPSNAAPSGSSSAPSGTDTCLSAGSGSGAPATITVGITPTDPAATGRWDHAPVQVGITTARVPGAIVVPVTALLAQSNGGYTVEVVTAARSTHLVPVSLGLFDDADGLVQVTGSGLAAGQKVVVPST